MKILHEDVILIL